jgi:hypothetical protein
VDESRVVRLRSAKPGPARGYRFGTGYVVAPGTVLTAAHVLGPLGTVPGAPACEVLPVGANPVTGWLASARVAVDTTTDLACVTVADLAPDVPTVSWGQLGPNATPVAWTAIGYPAAGNTAAGRQKETVWGEVSPASERDAGRLALVLRSRPAADTTTSTGAARSGWSGLSGAAVFSGQWLVGVVIEVPARFSGSLTGRRIEALGDQPDLFAAAGSPTFPVIEASLPATPPAAMGQGPVTAALLTHLRTEQFASTIAERTQHFVGRAWVFDQVQQLLDDPAVPGGYILIVGEPGIGKTAIAAELVRRYGWPHHFNIATQNIRTASDFLGNVSAQLIVRYSLDRRDVSASALTDSGLFVELLVEAVARVPKGTRVVVLVDALDESDVTGLAPGANRLLLPRTLPPGVFVVVTSRDLDDQRLTVDHLYAVPVRDDDPRNLADAEEYVTAFLAGHQTEFRVRLAEWSIEREEFVGELVARSEGNFMYLTHVLPSIANGVLAREGLDSVDQLPHGLRGYYRQHWRAMRAIDETRFETVQLPVLCVLAISPEPVTVAALSDWAGLPRGRVHTVLREWREFIEDDGTGRRFRLYHTTFAEFLDEEEDLAYYRALMVQSALARIPRLDPGSRIDASQ